MIECSKCRHRLTCLRQIRLRGPVVCENSETRGYRANHPEYKLIAQFIAQRSEFSTSELISIGISPTRAKYWIDASRDAGKLTWTGKRNANNAKIWRCIQATPAP